MNKEWDPILVCTKKNKINEAVEDLGKLIPYMKSKIKPSESLENLVD